MSRFVSAGTNENPAPRDEAWIEAQQQVEATRKPQLAQGKQDDGKSLYEVLQANKAAKQDAFEESARLKNQFRSLQDDEVEFLDSVLESTRAKENAVKQENAERLEAFRKQREAAEQAALDTSTTTDNTSEAKGSTDTWIAKKRRRKDKEAETPKLRKLSSSEIQPATRSESNPKSSTPSSAMASSVDTTVERGDKPVQTLKPPSTVSNIAKPATETTVGSLGLGAYSSDED